MGRAVETVCKSARAIETSPLCLGHMVEADGMLAVKQEAEELLGWKGGK